MKAKIAEVFQSIQGEGPHRCIRQVFVRFHGCNLECSFCDTKLNEYKEYTAPELFDVIDSFEDSFHSVSITGGEPLLQSGFLKEFLPLLKENNIKVYLETNGTLPYALKDIINYVDIVAMDFKLPSSTNRANFWDRHEGFLGLAKEKDVFVKVVVCDSTEKKDIEKAIELLRKFDSNITFILQPNSFDLNGSVMKKIAKFQQFCLEHLEDIRVIPQLHKVLNVK